MLKKEDETFYCRISFNHGNRTLFFDPDLSRCLVFDNESAAYQSRSSGGTCTGRTNIRIDKQKTGYDILNTDNLKSVISWAPQVGQMLMGGITSLALNIFVLIFVLYFMLLGNDKMENYIMDILPFTEKNKLTILHDVNMVVKSNAIGIPLLAVIQGAVAMLGYYIFNVPDLLLWGI